MSRLAKSVSDQGRDDVKVGNWSMPWNAKPDAGRLAAGIPSSNFWAFRLPGRQPGRLRLHGAGFRAAQWVGDHTESRDPQVRRSGDAFLALVKNTYRVLLTRGLKGC